MRESEEATVSLIKSTYIPHPRNGCMGNKTEGMTDSLGLGWDLQAVESFLYPHERHGSDSRQPARRDGGYLPGGLFGLMIEDHPNIDGFA